MEVKESPFFVEFADTTLGGGGFDAYLHQRGAILKGDHPEGHFQRLLKFSGKVAVIDYYLSVKLDALFVLSGHLVKAGEKREGEREILKGYIAAIEKQEEDE